jgi:hypothetical protein
MDSFTLSPPLGFVTGALIMVPITYRNQSFTEFLVIYSFLSLLLGYIEYAKAPLSISQKAFVISGAGSDIKAKNDAVKWIRTRRTASEDQVVLEEQKLEQESQSDYEKSLVSHYVNKKGRS